VSNFTPVPRPGYRLGVPFDGYWRELLNGDALVYGGSGLGNLGGVSSDPTESHGRPFSVTLTLPPLCTCYFRHESLADDVERPPRPDQP
jgi:1,4-alpha-glucan branching enzyme